MGRGNGYLGIGNGRLAFGLREVGVATRGVLFAWPYVGQG